MTIESPSNLSAKEQVEKDLISLVERFAEKADAARELAKDVGMTWHSDSNLVVNENGIQIADCSSIVASKVIILYSPEKILGASESKGKIAQQILDSFLEERYEDLLTNSFVAHILIEEYRGVLAADTFSTAVKKLANK